MLSKKIRLLLVERDMKGNDLAKALNCSPQNIYALLKKDNWNENQLRDIANKLDCDLEINFIKRENGEKI